MLSGVAQKSAAPLSYVGQQGNHEAILVVGVAPVSACVSIDVASKQQQTEGRFRSSLRKVLKLRLMERRRLSLDS